MGFFKHAMALVGNNAVIGDDTRIWAFTNVMDGAVIGKNCNICDHSFIEKGALLGDNVTVKNGVSVYDGIVLEDDVFVGPNAAFVNDRHPRSRKPGWKLERTTVQKGASIGSNATILCGVTIGMYAVVGAGSVVVKDVPPYTAVVGNPARPIGRVDESGHRVKGAA
ncbi:MAG: N-acetyltransferase [Candidatus Omnitrophica bacterium]|nr:N-acetyltransferase [Candidatus Omnitrophota bacterium]